MQTSSQLQKLFKLTDHKEVKSCCLSFDHLAGFQAISLKCLIEEEKYFCLWFTQRLTCCMANHFLGGWCSASKFSKSYCFTMENQQNKHKKETTLPPTHPPPPLPHNPYPISTMQIKQTQKQKPPKYNIKTKITSNISTGVKKEKHKSELYRHIIYSDVQEDLIIKVGGD